MGDSSIVVLGISRTKLAFHSIAASDPQFNEVYEELDSIRNIVSGDHIYDEEYSPEQYRTFIHSGFNLYNQLVGSVLDQLNENFRDLIIIPDGQLGYLPFELLISKLPENPVQVDYRNLDYLVKKYIIRYDYSTSLLNENIRLAHLPGNSYDNEYTGFAPGYSVSGSVPDTNKSTKIYKAGGVGIASVLKYNTEEITRAAKLFHGIVFSGKQASESNFKSDTIRSRILHLAAHAVLNNLHPEFSGITFSDYTGRETEDKDDGILYAHEIYNLNLNSDLVLLSACETGIGKIARGEGIISLARAFKYAGCRNIVMSLWKANDQTTSEIMCDFCKNLKKGMPKDEALQKAKLKYLETSEHSHPFYWATFVLIGDNLPVEKSILSSKILVPVVSFLLLMVIIFLVRKKQLFKKATDNQRI
jgi:CHAT domain-containing protein